MITFIQFLEATENETEAKKDAFKNQLQLNIDNDQGFTINLSKLDIEKIKTRLKSWSKYDQMSKEDKTMIKSIIGKSSSTLNDLFNAFYNIVNRKTEESDLPSPKF